MLKLRQTPVFQLWVEQLKDRRAKTIIATRIARLVSGLAGGVSAVGSGISELRIHHGPGYRIYFQKRENTLVLLLCGGDKSSQPSDIETAHSLARQPWKDDGNDDEN